MYNYKEMENYSELLKNSKWHTKCVEILNRDNHKCALCNKVGYHNATIMTYHNANELDCVFSEFKFDGKSISSFFDTLIRQEENFINITAKCKYNDDDVPVLWNNYYNPEVFVKSEDEIKNPYKYYFINSVVKRNLFFRVMPSSEYPLDDNVIRGLGIDNIEITSSNINKNPFHAGGIFKFSKVLTDNYVMTLQSLYAGIVADRYTSSQYNDIIINISHNNFCLCLYLIPSFNRLVKIIPGLNVHHNYYTIGKTPWEYSAEALITLCEDCHQKTHKKYHIPIYKDIKGEQIFYKNTETCERCGGSGYLPQYNHVENGICFKCWGEGVVLEGLGTDT